MGRGALIFTLLFPHRLCPGSSRAGPTWVTQPEGQGATAADPLLESHTPGEPAASGRPSPASSDGVALLSGLQAPRNTASPEERETDRGERTGFWWCMASFLPSVNSASLINSVTQSTYPECKGELNDPGWTVSCYFFSSFLRHNWQIKWQDILKVCRDDLIHIHERIPSI